MDTDRTWAKGLTQFEFEREYLKRIPWADVIPDVSLWANEGEPTYHGINGFNLEQMTMDGPAVIETVVVPEGEKKVPHHLQKKEKAYPCRGCGRLFDYAIARAGHERACKTVIQKEV